MNFNEQVYEYVKKVPCGKVTTYGDIARALGAPRASRIVGRALHFNPQPGIIPCHRVVFRDGSLADSFAFGGREVQRAVLESEGVEITDFTVNMSKHRWEGD